MTANRLNASSNDARLHPLTGGTRWPWVVLGLTSLGVLVLSRTLTASPTGIGTHTQLGLPPCGFHWLTGLPCPACGMTTGFCHMARWQWADAFDAHALSPLLFVLTVVAVPCAAVGFVRHVDAAAVLRRGLVLRGLATLIAIAGAVWVLRVLALLT